MTLQQRLQRYFRAHGYEQVSRDTAHTLMLCKYAGRGTRYVFIARAGDVRTANQAHITESRAMYAPMIIQQRMTEWERSQGIEN